MKQQLALSCMLMMAVLSGCTTTPAKRWYRGNTHTHTVICGHADSPPETVAAWYHDRGYHFLILSEHNHFIDPAEVRLPTPTREDFILIPGVELTGMRHIHSTAMNVTSVPPWKFSDEDKSKIISNHVHETTKLGGELILNHPNFHYAVSAKDMVGAKELRLFELFNGHPTCNNHGDATHPSTEAMWDDMLTRGKLIYGVSSDDAHHFQKISPNVSNPGRGWVMVHADSLDPDTITQAIRSGDFYASNGVLLKTYEINDTAYRIQVDTEKTQAELEGNPLLRGKAVDKGTPGYRIDYIGPGGKVVSSINGSAAIIAINPDLPYVRAKVTYTRQKPGSEQLEEYYAWGQPVFTDNRADTHTR